MQHKYEMCSLPYLFFLNFDKGFLIGFLLLLFLGYFPFPCVSYLILLLVHFYAAMYFVYGTTVTSVSSQLDPRSGVGICHRFRVIEIVNSSSSCLRVFLFPNRQVRLPALPLPSLKGWSVWFLDACESIQLDNSPYFVNPKPT